MAILNAKEVTKRFGGLVAVDSFDFEIENHAIASIIGPNGAGKTTFFNCITGFEKAEEGEIIFDGIPIHHLRPDQVAHLGISRTYQNIRLFAEMTALENILVGQHLHLVSNWIGALLRTRSTRQEENFAWKEAGRLLKFIGLAGKGDLLAKFSS